jgi:integrase
VPRIALTDRFVQNAKPIDGKRTDYFDSVAKGLALRVGETGHKAWTFHFTSATDDKRARMTLGSYPATSLADARRQAIEARGHLEAGRDPRSEKAAQDAAALTVRGLTESYLARHVRPTLRSADAIERRFALNVDPIIGALKIEDVTRRDVTRVVDSVLKRGSPIEANRVFAHLRSLFRWAVGRGDLQINPVQGMKPPSSSTTRDRVLSDQEIRHLWNSLPSVFARSVDCQRIIKILLLTGQRAGEVSGMEVRELDLSERVWTIPGSRTKNSQRHIVPLSDQAVQIIREAVSDARDGARYIFPSNGAGLPSAAISRTIGRALAPTKELPLGRLGMTHWTAHDLRRTALTGMGRLGTAPIVLGHIANHLSTTKAGVTLSVYARHSYEVEKRQAMEAWAEWLERNIVVEVGGIR